VIIVGQREQAAPGVDIRYPVVRHIVRQTVAHVGVASVDEEFDRVRADRADRKVIALTRQRIPASGALPGDPSQAVGRRLNTRPLLSPI